MLTLESVAMTDIVLNMFIFFFISFSLLYTFNPHRVQKIDVKLPKASNVAAITDTNQLTITLNNEGLLYLDNELVNIKDLEARLKERLSLERSVVVIIRVDRLVAFKHVVKVLDTISGLGINRISIAAIKE